MLDRTSGGFRLAVDIGGTFTDIVLETPTGFISDKVLTTPAAPEEGVMTGVKRVLARAGVAATQIGFAIHGTTLATNAIIERRGARTAIVTTQGFRDTLEFAFGHRFDQYDLELQRPAPLIARPLRFEVVERMAADGAILLDLDERSVREVAARLRANEIESVAICFVHAYRNGAHERRARDILLEEIPGLHISLSHEVCPEIREYERTSTTAANAYVQPLMATYLRGLTEGLNALGLTAPLLMIMSAGSLTSVETAIRLPIRLVESGPAGGAILGQHVARQLHEPRSVALDMGGTTAKVILLTDYEPRHSRSMEVARAYRFLPGSGLPLRIPVIDMIEIGAGGGSIAHIDELNRIAVGPESAGSSPGPACYGLGGDKPAVTDADFILGKLDGETFAAGTMKLDEICAHAAMREHVGAPLTMDTVVAAAGVCEIVDENMANATRVHAADAGEDVSSRVLIATGGAGPLHAARIAQKLGITKIVVPKGAGVGSAYGFLQAPVAYQAVHSQYMRLDSFDPAAVTAIFDRLRSEAEAIVRMAAPGAQVLERRYADLRYRGQGHELNVDLPVGAIDAQSPAHYASRFEERYKKNYGRIIPGLAIEALTWMLTLSAQIQKPAASAPALPTPSHAPVERSTRVFDAAAGEFVETKVIRRENAPPGATFEGPALVMEDQTTIWVPREFGGEVSAHGHIVLTRKD